MKKWILYLLLLLPSIGLFAQSGRWEGTLDVQGMKLDLSIELEEKESAWKGSMDIPMQNIKNMELGDLAIEKEAISFKLPKVPGNASFKGKFIEDFSKIEGTFSQGGMEFPLELIKRDIAVDPQALADYSTLVDSLLKELNVAGAGVGIIKGGKVVLAEGFGYRDYENKVKADANTLFAIGSSSKAFTTMGLGMLVDEGELDWTKPVVDYMPDFKLWDEFATQEMTAVDLVTHQSGLPRHDIMWYATDFSRKGLFDRLQYLEPTKSFRTTFQYNNLMFMTAGLLIEELSGKSWEDFTKEEIFKPLGMKRSNCSVNDSQKQDNFSLPYQVKEDEITKMDFHNIDAVGPAGSINSSINDMMKWVKFHLDLGKVNGQELIAEGQIKKMHSPHKTIIGSGMGTARFGPTAYGLGWFIMNYGDTYIVEHGGNIDGFSALVYLLPKEDIGIVVLSNQNGSALPTYAARYAVDMLLEKEAVDWYQPNDEEEEDENEEEKKEEATQIEGTKPHHDNKEYVGTYEHEGYGKVSITDKDGKLVAQYYELDLPLTHWHFETFQGKVEYLDLEILMTFQTDKLGKVVSLSAPFEPTLDDIIFKKLPPDLLSDPEFLNKLVGKYELEGMAATVKYDGKKLSVTVPGQPPYTLEAKQGTTFALKGLNGFTLKFAIEEGDEFAKEITFFQPNGTFTAKRVKE